MERDVRDPALRRERPREQRTRLVTEGEHARTVILERLVTRRAQRAKELGAVVLDAHRHRGAIVREKDVALEHQTQRTFTVHPEEEIGAHVVAPHALLFRRAPAQSEKRRRAIATVLVAMADL